MVLPLLAGRRFQVLFHSPRRGAFHLSLTVLVHYRLPGSIQPCETVLTDSRRVPRVPRYSGFRSGKTEPFRIRGYHPLRRAVPGASATILFCNFPTVPENCPIGPLNTAYATLPGYHTYAVWAVSVSLAATSEITVVFFSWGYLDVSVRPVRLIILCIRMMMSRHYPGRVSPFGNLRIRACLAAPRSLSQPAASFVASRHQGIHRLPLLT